MAGQGNGGPTVVYPKGDDGGKSVAELQHEGNPAVAPVVEQRPASQPQHSQHGGHQADVNRDSSDSRSQGIHAEEGIKEAQSNKLTGSLQNEGQPPYGDSPFIAPRAGEQQRGAPSDIPWDAEHINMSNEVDKMLLFEAQQGGVPAVLAVVRDHGDTFTQENVKVALQQLAHLSRDLPEQDLRAAVHSNEAFHRLVRMVIRDVHQFAARDLEAVEVAVKQLKYEDGGLADALSGVQQDKP